MDYADVKAVRDKEWRDAWDSMPAEQRAELERAMASNTEYPVETRKVCVGSVGGGRASRTVVHDTSDAKPDAGGRVVVGRTEDAASIADHHPDFCDAPDFATEVDSVPDELRERFGLSMTEAVQVAQWHGEHVTLEVRRQVSLMLLRVIGFFLLPGNIQLRAHALAHAARMAAMNGLRSMRHSAEVCKVSVEAIRKVAWRWVSLLNFPPLEAAKSDEARVKYSIDKKNNHWRNQKCKPKMGKLNGTNHHQAAAGNVSRTDAEQGTSEDRRA